VLLVHAWADAATRPPSSFQEPSLPPAAAPWETAVANPRAWAPVFHGSDATLQRSYRLGSDRVDLHAAYYAFQSEEGEAINHTNTLLGGGKDWRALKASRAEIEFAGRSHPYLRMIVSNRND